MCKGGIFLKKIGLFIICLLIIFATTFSYLNKEKDESSVVKIRVAEVTHSLFYAPFYVAIENGYFEDEGIDIELILTSGADKVSAAVLSGDVEVGFAGPESSIYIYNGGEKDYLMNFAGLTKRDGQFIVSREKIEDFNLNDLLGKEILAGRAGGMPILNFYNALDNENIDSKQININTSVEFAALAGNFIAGTGDFVNLFEPTATKIENEKLGYVVASVGELSGEVPYTAFNARKSYIESNKEILIKFTKALNKGIKFVEENDNNVIAEAVLPQFNDSNIEEIEMIINRYKESDTWLDSPYISKESFNNLKNIMKKNNLLEKDVKYEDLVINLYEK